MTQEPENVTLSQPIKAHGQSLSSITLKPPKGIDYRQAGMPINLRTWEVNTEAMVQMIARLAGIPPSSVDMMEGGDWLKCVDKIIGFMGGSVTTAASSTTLSE